jgi:integrase
MLTKPYPKDNEARTMELPPDLVTQLTDWIHERHLGPDDLLFATRHGTPISRNTFRTRVWLPAVQAAGIDLAVRVHDLRHAHASWLLAGGSDLKSVMDRMGHAQITTTQKYLHALPDADQKNLDALNRIRVTTRTDPRSETADGAVRRTDPDRAGRDVHLRHPSPRQPPVWSDLP